MAKATHSALSKHGGRMRKVSFNPDEVTCVKCLAGLGLMHGSRDYTGQQFGELRCLGPTDDFQVDAKGHRHKLWSFSCACGSEVLRVPATLAFHGYNSNCGCRGNKSHRTANTTASAICEDLNSLAKTVA